MGIDHIILFDGICNLCNGVVDFIMKRDKNHFFRFIPLQSKNGNELLNKFSIQPDTMESIILIKGETYYSKSTAIIRICILLGGFWSLTYLFTIIPASWRDSIYDFIARHRYRWFGKRKECRIFINNGKE